MKSFPVLIVSLLCLACSDPIAITVNPVEEPPISTPSLSSKTTSIYCYSSMLGKNIAVFYLDSSLNSIIRNPSQDWINGHFESNIENKQFFNSISFPNDTVAIRLFLPSEDSTLIRQAFVSGSNFIKTIGSGTYSSGYLYPPNKELQISWDFTDSQGVRVSPGWYAFCTEFIEEDRAILFWFYLFE
ncbi:MAG: hypothetical protein U9N45_07875 [Gemmatimonadota bacterium]|nr:hypothetical protein [Gemmatimonadota bacterium]